MLRDRENYSVDLGGAYNITRSIAVTGGVRYNVERERSAVVADNRRDSQAISSAPRSNSDRVA